VVPDWSSAPWYSLLRLMALIWYLDTEESRLLWAGRRYLSLRWPMAVVDVDVL
jgi:hypothetical protein